MKVNEVVPPVAILAVPNAIAIDGGDMTTRLPLAVLPVPASVEVIVTLWFFTPDEVPVTFIVMVQVVFAAKVPAARLAVEDPAAAVAVPPHPLLVRFEGVAMTSPAGRVSLKAMPVSAVEGIRLWIVNVSDVVPLSGTEVAPKEVSIVTAPTLNVPLTRVMV